MTSAEKESGLRKILIYSFNVFVEIACTNESLTIKSRNIAFIHIDFKMT